MGDPGTATVAIVDYGMGNLFSVSQACDYAGLSPVITSSRHEVMNSDSVILPGVGAFGDAMDALAGLDLVGPLQEIANSDTPLMAICLGMQLLMTESHEFGQHRGLEIIEGSVVRLSDRAGDSKRIKVPHVGWNRIQKKTSAEVGQSSKSNGIDPWSGSPLSEIDDGEFMYFVHSLYAQPEDASQVLSMSRYGDTEFCSSMWTGNIFACQFHPERSGSQGLEIYRKFAELTRETQISKVNKLG